MVGSKNFNIMLNTAQQNELSTLLAIAEDQRTEEQIKRIEELEKLKASAGKSAYQKLLEANGKTFQGVSVDTRRAVKGKAEFLTEIGSNMPVFALAGDSQAAKDSQDRLVSIGIETGQLSVEGDNLAWVLSLSDKDAPKAEVEEDLLKIMEVGIGRGNKREGEGKPDTMLYTVKCDDGATYTAQVDIVNNSHRTPEPGDTLQLLRYKTIGWAAGTRGPNGEDRLQLVIKKGWTVSGVGELSESAVRRRQSLVVQNVAKSTAETTAGQLG